jgi:hypothetical protein
VATYRHLAGSKEETWESNPSLCHRWTRWRRPRRLARNRAAELGAATSWGSQVMLDDLPVPVDDLITALRGGVARSTVLQIFARVVVFVVADETGALVTHVGHDGVTRVCAYGSFKDLPTGGRGCPVWWKSCTGGHLLRMLPSQVGLVFDDGRDHQWQVVPPDDRGRP